MSAVTSTASLPIGVAQGLEAAPALPVRHRVQGHELAVGQADAQLLQGVEPGALGARQEHPHLQLVRAHLDQLRQMAVEGGAQLPAQSSVVTPRAWPAGETR